MKTLSRFLTSTAIEPPSEAAAAASEAVRQDETVLLRSGLADNEKFRAVLDKFVARLPQRIEEIQHLLDAQNMEHLVRAIHQVKGAAGGYGFPDITLAASRAEESIKRAEDLASITGQVEQLVSLIRRVEGFPENSIALAAKPKQDQHGGDSPPDPLTTTSTPATAPRTHADPLTGLPNRTNLLERLSAEVSIARRGEGDLACIAIRVEQLDSIVTRFSQAAADAIIRRLAALFEAHCDHRGTVYRPDTSHFVVVVSGLKQADANPFINEIAERLAAERFTDLIGDANLSIIFGHTQLTLATTCAATLVSTAIQAITAHHPTER